MSRSPNQIAISEGMKRHWRQRKNKFGNKPTVVDGVRFASKAEAKRDGDLHIRQLAGEIRNLTRQPRFPLIVNGRLICTYIGDWLYEEALEQQARVIGHNWKSWHKICEDKKGVLTKEFKIKWALAKALHPEIEWRLS